MNFYGSIVHLQCHVLGAQQNYMYIWASQVVLVVRDPPAKEETEETWVRSLGWKDPLVKETTSHSSILV